MSTSAHDSPVTRGVSASESGGAKSIEVLDRDEIESILRSNGLDPESTHVAAELEKAAMADGRTIRIDTAHKHSVLSKVLTNQLAVPNWQEFVADVQNTFTEVHATVHGGQNADYIPILARADPTQFAVAVCTVDGQKFHMGDADTDFSIQSCVKPITYALAVEESGLKRVHRHIGIEPSGLAFNEVSLNKDRRPHNPMINAGAIVSGSLIKPDADMSERFQFFMDALSDLAGGAPIGFSQATYLCEYETAWRNNALMFHMREAGVFPKGVPPEQILDFYIQCCATEVNAKAAATIAATLAKGGVCPTTGTRCLSASTVKSCLTLMLSCGMYDYSGSWMLYVGLPAKSGVAGLVYVVIPHVMGIAIWSPPLDSHGNSHKAVEFYKRLLSKYKFGIFDRFVQQSRYALADEEAAADSGAGMAPLQKRFAGSSAEAVTARLEAHEVGTAASRRHIVTQLGAVRRDKLRKAAMRLRTILSGFRRLWRRGQEIDGSVLVFNLAKALVPVATVVTALQEEGIDVASHKLAGRQLKEMEAATVADNGEAGRGQVSFPSLFLPDADHANVILRALEGSLVVKSFSKFTADISMIYTVVKSISSADAEKASVLTTAARDRGPTAEAEAVGKAALRRAVSTAEAEEVAPPGPGMPLRTGRGSVHGRGSVFGRGSAVGTARRPGGGFGRGGDSSSLTSFEDGEEVVRYPYGVAVCTVDGQQFTSGDTDWSVPLMSVVKPLLYAMALEDIGEDVVSQWVATEPTQVDPAGFDLLKPGSSHGGGGDESHSEVPMAAKETEAEEKEGEEEEEGKAGASARRGSSASAAARVPARPHDSLRAYNPFMDSGSLAVCSLLGCGKAHKVPATFRGTSEKFSFVTSRLSKWSGNNKVQFSNPNFLALKQRALKPKAVSHYMKGMDCMLPESDPTDTAYLMYQSYSIQTSLPQLATIAATIAAIGRCPTTGERCMSGDVVKRLLSTMYSAGLNRYSGRWNFTVGIPAVYSSASGLLMLVIPNVAGMVIWAPSAISYAAGFAQPSIPPHPRSHEAATFGLLQELARILLDGRALLTDDVVEHRARRFCELLTEKFHVNVFDQLVHGDDQVEAHDEDEDDLVAKEETPRTKLGRAATAALLFFELCTAAGNGDLMAVRKLIDDGVDVARADYDKRTALHIACSDGHLAVATLLVDTGAPVLAKDRWGQTPLDDARKSGNPSLVMVLEAALRRQGRSVPAARA